MGRIVPPASVVEDAPSRPDLPRPPSLSRSVGLTGAVQVLAAAAIFYNYWLVRWRWGVDELGQYSQVMRVRGVLEWVVLVMLPVALTRQLARRRADPTPEGQRLVVWTGLGLALALLGVCGLALALFPTAAAKLFYGHVRMSPWIRPSAILLFGYGLCLMVGAVARGFMLFTHANLLQLAFAALLPTAILLLGADHSLRQLITAMGLAAALVASLFFLLLVPTCGGRAAPLWRGPRKHVRTAQELLSYGAPRLSTLACVGLMNLSLPWLVSNAGERSLLAAVNGLLGVVSATAILIAPLGFVLLPHLTQLLAKGDELGAGKLMSALLEGTVSLGGAASLLALGLLQPVVRAWLGPEIASHTPLMIASAAAIPGLLVLELLRSPLDAAAHAPWNALSYGSGALATIATFFGMAGLANAPLASTAAWAMALGYVTAAIAAAGVARRLYRLTPRSRALASCAVVFCTGVSILLLEHRFATAWIRAGSSVALTGVYLVTLLLGRPPWLATLFAGRMRRNDTERDAP